MSDQTNLYPDKMNADESALKKIGIVIGAVILFVVGIITGRSVDGLDSFDVSNIINHSDVKIVGDIDGANAPENIDFDLYWQVWGLTSDRFVDQTSIDNKKMFYESIKGMVSASGDPHTIFLDPTETKAFNDSNTGNYFSGIGAELGYADGWPIIVAPLKGSPAKEAGILSGDAILAVDGVDVTADDSIFDLVAVIRGEKSSIVTLTVLHDGETEPIDIEIVRDDITVESMDVVVENGIAVIGVSRFTDASLREWNNNWDNVVKSVIDQGATSIVLDLRGNPGGFMDAAAYAASDFLKEGALIFQQEDRDGHISEEKVSRKGRLLDIPVIVLVNSGSASASEILTGALQKNNRATVVGEESFGKGTAQEVLDFDDGSSLHVTVMKWLLPDGTWINKENKIKPDNVVELTPDDFKEGIDPQMDKALELLK